jgi:hypothetical protein
MEIKGSEIGSLGRLVDYLPAVKPAPLYVWLAVRGLVIYVPLDRLKSTWLIQLLGACKELRECRRHSGINTKVFISITLAI